MLRKFLLGTVAALGVVGASAVAQQWLNYPIVGGSSFCSSTVNSTCVNTVPAGPALPGTATVPTDINLPNGRSPQTAQTPVAVLGLGGIQNEVPTAGSQITLAKGVGRLLLKPAGTIASTLVKFPPSTVLYDGQVLIIASSQTVTLLTMSAGTGTTIAATAATTVTADAPIMLIYSAASATWFQIVP